MVAVTAPASGTINMIAIPIESSLVGFWKGAGYDICANNIQKVNPANTE
jgi:hypothetical protein